MNVQLQVWSPRTNEWLNRGRPDDVENVVVKIATMGASFYRGVNPDDELVLSPRMHGETAIEYIHRVQPELLTVEGK